MQSSVTEFVRHETLPRFVMARQIFPRPVLSEGEIFKRIREGVATRAVPGVIGPGRRICITAGSRGIRNIDLITKSIVSEVQGRGAEAFIVPAMGSHGGARAEGQSDILREYGITEETMGCPILATMETKQVGATADGIPVFIDRYAAEADGIIVVNRVKPHTSFRGPYESGLMKMLAIGLGKQKGADFCHASGFRFMANRILSIGKEIIEQASVILGIAILENAYDETCGIHALSPDEIISEEPRLLQKAWDNMARIWFDDCDILVVRAIGKNFSGDGMDPNVTGRCMSGYNDKGIKSVRLGVLDLSDESHGAASGMGRCDIASRRFYEKIRFERTYPNFITTGNTGSYKMPIIVGSDLEVFQTLLHCCWDLDRARPRIIVINNSMQLDTIGGISGGLVSAILLRIPGTPSSVATCFDGHPMAVKGEAGKALGVGIFYSFLGTIAGIFCLVGIAPSLASIALKFHTYEYFSVGLFSVTMMCALCKGEMAKGLFVGFLGMVLAMVGPAALDGLPRMTLGIHALEGGFDILPLLIGAFAVSEILAFAKSKGQDNGVAEISSFHIKGLGFSLQEAKSQTINFLRSALIGIGIGVLPGIGGGTANVVAYAVAKNSDKNPERFGTGVIDGIVASEASNNATIGGALIPLLTLGIPGDTVTALLLGALTIQGLTPGPLLFTKNGPFVYSIFAACIICSFLMLFIMYGGIRGFVRVLRVPKHILLPIVMVLCCVGAFGLNSRVFDIWCILFFGLLALVLESFHFPMPPIILGFILESMIESNLRRGLQQSRDGFLTFLTRPISAAFLVITVIVVVAAFYRQGKEAREKRKAEAKLAADSE